MTEFHFKRLRRNSDRIVEEYAALWQESLRKGERDFKASAEYYLDSAERDFARRMPQWSKEMAAVRNSLLLHPLFLSLFNRCPVKYSFTALMSMDESQWLLNKLATSNHPEEPTRFIEQVVTLFIAWFMNHSLKACGDKAYLVKPDLRWALENTELKGFPSDNLRLPFPSIYVDVENLIEVFNPETGMHKSIGVYITEDTARIPRTWRLLVVGKGKAESALGEQFDDALYHFQLMFPEGSTVDEAVQYTFNFLSKDQPVREVELEFDGRKVLVTHGHISEENQEQFVMMWSRLLRLFKYVMNVAIYSTTQDADVQFRAASPEYQALRERAMRATGNKRRDLFDRLKKVDPNNAYVLGGSVVIDRAPKTAADNREGEHRTQKVRSLVSGHFRLYHVGQGRTESINKWVAPFWRGPEHAPLTTKQRVVK